MSNAPHTPTFREAAERWLEAMQGVVSDKTVAHYRWLLENVQDAALNAITEETVQALVARRKAEGLSENSVYMLPRLIRRVLDHAAAEGLCEAPGWQIKPETPEKEHKETLLTPSEERQLLQYLTAHPEPRNLVLDLILSTGISGSEALQLTWADVSFRQSRIRVAGRQVPIDERQRIQLQKQRSLPTVYLASGTPEPLKAPALRNGLLKACKEAGVPPTTLTGLRRTFAVRQLEGGMDYGELAKTLDQKNDRTFRALYRALVSSQTKDRLEQTQLASRKVRQAPKHIRKAEKDPEIRTLEDKIETRKRELKEALDSLEGDLEILRQFRKSGGQAREAFYAFVEKVLGDDKDGKLLVEYLRCNLRVAAMPSRERLSAQAIRRRVTRGFSKLTARLDQL